MDEAGDHDRNIDHPLGLAEAVFDDDALDHMLQRIVVLAHHTVDKAHSVSITVADNGRYRTSNFTADEALAIDEAQYEGDSGPCLEALRTARQIQVDIGGDGDRWPRFESRARAVGIASVLSTPLVQSPGTAIGALNIYARDAGGFGESERHKAELLAEHAAILVASALALVGATNLNEQLRMALASREVIGEAKGIIMERQRCNREEAFDILRRASQRENRKLRDLAEELVLRVEGRRREGPAGR